MHEMATKLSFKALIVFLVLRPASEGAVGSGGVEIAKSKEKVELKEAEVIDVTGLSIGVVNEGQGNHQNDTNNNHKNNDNNNNNINNNNNNIIINEFMNEVPSSEMYAAEESSIKKEVTSMKKSLSKVDVASPMEKCVYYDDSASPLEAPSQREDNEETLPLYPDSSSHFSVQLKDARAKRGNLYEFYARKRHHSATERSDSTTPKNEADQCEWEIIAPANLLENEHFNGSSFSPKVRHNEISIPEMSRGASFEVFTDAVDNTSPTHSSLGASDSPGTRARVTKVQELPHGGAETSMRPSKKTYERPTKGAKVPGRKAKKSGNYVGKGKSVSNRGRNKSNSISGETKRKALSFVRPKTRGDLSAAAEDKVAESFGDKVRGLHSRPISINMQKPIHAPISTRVDPKTYPRDARITSLLQRADFDVKNNDSISPVMANAKEYVIRCSRTPGGAKKEKSPTIVKAKESAIQYSRLHGGVKKVPRSLKLARLEKAKNERVLSAIKARVEASWKKVRDGDIVKELDVLLNS